MMLTLAAVFMSVALVTGTAASAALTSRATRKRLLEVTRGLPAVTLPDILPLSSQEPTTGAWSDIARLIPRSPKEMAKLRMRLMRAGFRSPGAPVIYSLIEMIGPVLAGGLPLLFARTPQVILGAFTAAVLTFFAPGLVIGQRLAKRRREIENGLPDALDLLVVCIEAGSGIDQAIQKAGEELSLAYPALGDELRIMTMEVRAGKPRLEAFKNFAQRTKVDDVRALVAMLIQTDRFGTSIGQALRTHSEVSRTRRRQRAEEQAQKIGVKLVFPLVLFFFPAFYIVVLGPAVIQFVRQFMSN
jgi:tight adherence protein C